MTRTKLRSQESTDRVVSLETWPMSERSVAPDWPRNTGSTGRSQRVPGTESALPGGQSEPNRQARSGLVAVLWGGLHDYDNRVIPRFARPCCVAGAASRPGASEGAGLSFARRNERIRGCFFRSAGETKETEAVPFVRPRAPPRSEPELLPELARPPEPRFVRNVIREVDRLVEFGTLDRAHAPGFPLERAKRLAAHLRHPGAPTGARITLGRLPLAHLSTHAR